MQGIGLNFMELCQVSKQNRTKKKKFRQDKSRNQDNAGGLGIPCPEKKLEKIQSKMEGGE
jgi:hypothetical protein